MIDVTQATPEEIDNVIKTLKKIGADTTALEKALKEKAEEAQLNSLEGRIGKYLSDNGIDKYHLNPLVSIAQDYIDFILNDKNNDACDRDEEDEDEDEFDNLDLPEKLVDALKRITKEKGNIDIKTKDVFLDALGKDIKVIKVDVDTESDFEEIMNALNEFKESCSSKPATRRFG